jgi:hypothetical protein
MEMISYYLGKISPDLTTGISVRTLVGLGVAMNQLRADRILVGNQTDTFYSPLERNAVEHPFHHSRLLDLESLRASHVSTLLAVPEAKDALEHLRRKT